MIATLHAEVAELKMNYAKSPSIQIGPCWRQVLCGLLATQAKVSFWGDTTYFERASRLWSPGHCGPPPFSVDRIRREHRMEKFSEVMPNSWTNNLNFIDKNAAEKEESPDERTIRLAGELEADMASFRALAREFSIEKKFQSK